MPNKTPLYEMHRELGGFLVNFAGWDLPLHYGSQIDEHLRVRRDAGMFDVSHMGIVDIKGEDVQKFLRVLLANNIDKLKAPGTALYSCMLNIEGGVLDDLIVYFISQQHYRLVLNAATTAKDVQWISKEAKDFSVQITLREDLAIIAVQGPNARHKVGLALPQLKSEIDTLKHFHFFERDHHFIARTGYTGEDGLEMIIPAKEAVALWKLLLLQGVLPVGLGARDTLRLEAGFNLYGQDMDGSVTPLESNLAWTVAFKPEERQFNGREELMIQMQKGIREKLVGIELIEKGVLRRHQSLFVGDEKIGMITSGTFSPTLKRSIALARIRCDVNKECLVEIRGKFCQARVMNPPFIKGDQT